MRYKLPSVFVLIFFVFSVKDAFVQQPDSVSSVEITYAVGAELLFLKSAEDRGVEFKEDGKVKPGLDIFRDQESNSGGPRKAFMEDVNETLLNVSSRKIRGIFWWEPASGCGRDYFDEECNARPVINVFDRYKRGETEE